MKSFLRRWVLRLLGISAYEGRLQDLERHFVTKRNADGVPIETLADVPLDQRKHRELSTRGMTWQQRRAWLEKTDGGRNISN